MFNLSIFGCDPAKATGVAFVIIHYNRLHCLSKCLESVWSNIRNGDCIIFIDNGSPARTQQEAISIFRHGSANTPEDICKIIATTSSNKTGGPAYYCALDIITSSLLPNLKHAIILADDDLLTLGWRGKITPYLLYNNWIVWGYHYISWPSEEIQLAKKHSGHVIQVSGEEMHDDWLHSISNQKYNSKLILKDKTSPQAHSSCGLLPIKALKIASKKFETIVPLPYGDVGLAMMVKYANKVIYIDEPLGLIGRGSNYGMGDTSTMVANHPTRQAIHGQPSHSKYLAATYLECLFMLNRLDLLLPTVGCALKYHLDSTYITRRPPLRYLMGKVKRADFPSCWRMLPDILLSILMMAPRTLAKPLECYILWILGGSKDMKLRHLKEIQILYLDIIRKQEANREISYQIIECNSSALHGRE